VDRPWSLTRSPSSCAKDFPTCAGSSTAWSRARARACRPRQCCLPHCLTASALQTFRFRGSMAGPRAPLSTLREWPHGRARMTRGQGGSLLLSCIELPSTILRQFHWRTKRPVTTISR
jgi:hypothetical protein